MSGSSLREQVETLSADRARLLELMLQNASPMATALKPYPRAPGEVRFPTSWAQQRLWFVYQLEGAAAAYNIPWVVRLCGVLDESALRDALHALVRRHEVLRTVFVNVEGDPRQDVRQDVRFSLQRIDLQSHAPAQREHQVRLQQREESQAPFDLSEGPLIRGRLLHLQENEHLLLITMHHIVSDGWSMGVMFRELAQLYGAFHEGRPDPLPPLPIQYADYVKWQREWLQGKVLEKQLAFWRARLEDAAPELELPIDHPRPVTQSYRGQRVPVVFDAKLSARLRALARRHGMTVFMVLYAAWAILLSRLSGQEDIVIGTPAANRRRPQLEGLIGFFVNTLVLRVAVAGEARVSEFLKQVKEVTLSAFEHQDVPFEQLVESLRPQRAMNRHPIFQTMFVLQNAPQSELTMPQLTIAIEESLNETSKFDLLLSLEECGDQIVGNLNYDTALFERGTMERWLARYGVLLEAIVQSDSTPIEHLPILPESERRLILEQFNATHAPYTPQQPIHRLFEQQAERTPDAAAVVHGQCSLTYAQLNRRANRLARYLRTKHVGPDELVCVCLERGLDMVMAVLGILKAGGAYVPLDPSYPPERLQYMLQDAAPRVIVTQSMLKHLVGTACAELFEVDRELPQLADHAADNVYGSESGVKPHNLLYVIYTSGSTGRPKGTAMPHGAMVNLIEWHRATFHDERPRVLQFAALSFDVAFQEIFSTLCTGGTLVMLDEWVRRDARALLEVLNNNQVERLFLPPLMLQSVAECCKSTGQIPATVRDVITAGEQLRITPEVVSFFQNLRRCRLHNHYGPTETHVVTALTLTGDPERWPALPSIGRPIANTQVYILDPGRCPVALGAVGEIYLAGANLARGYLRRPEMTAERFLPDPFSTDPQGRMYRSGDLGRWRHDGTIEYLGRNDEQVKIRGFRVELEEIEAHLTLHSDVQAAVVARDDAPGGKRLVAYLAARGSNAPDVNQLRAHLKAVLPDHMVPSAFVVLQGLPTTPSGKLNRRALPAPQLEAYAGRLYEPPQNEVEATLAALWQQLLQVERVGREDNFFELGGHSLLVLKALFRINQSCHCSLSVSDVYKSPTLRELAARITGAADADRIVDLRQEATLDESIGAAPGLRRITGADVLVTGATGFVGRFLVAQLLEETSGTIYCLVRARSRDAAAARLESALTQWRLWSEEAAQRVCAVPGDLRLPRLGLDERDWDMLAQLVGAIYHCATSMNHLETYAMAKAANVDGTREVLALATSGSLKQVNFISSLGIFGSGGADQPRIVSELSAIDDERHWHSQGYVASKWVGERVIALADTRGIPCNIFRLGLVWGDSEQGRYDPLQHGYRTLKSCMLSGCGIQGYRYAMLPIPVDYATRAILFLANRHCEGHGVFHIASQRSMTEGVFERYNRVARVPLRLLPFYDWICEIKRLHQGGRALPVVPLIEYAFGMNEKTFYEHEARRSSLALQIDCARTHQELERAGIVVPAFDDSFLGICVANMVSTDAELNGLFRL